MWQPRPVDTPLAVRRQIEIWIYGSPDEMLYNISKKTHPHDALSCLIVELEAVAIHAKSSVAIKASRLYRALGEGLRIGNCIRESNTSIISEYSEPPIRALVALAMQRICETHPKILGLYREIESHSVLMGTCPDLKYGERLADASLPIERILGELSESSHFSYFRKPDYRITANARLQLKQNISGELFARSLYSTRETLKALYLSKRRSKQQINTLIRESRLLNELLMKSISILKKHNLLAIRLNSKHR